MSVGISPPVKAILVQDTGAEMSTDGPDEGAIARDHLWSPGKLVFALPDTNDGRM